MQKELSYNGAVKGCQHICQATAQYLSLLCSRKFRLDIGYGLSWPAFRAIVILVVTGEFFHLLDVFQRLSGSDSSENISAVKFSPQRYLKGIIKWYCHRVPYITCHEGIKR
ncbi:hypothetical protein ACLBR5_14000 [Escherichia coli]